ncbi:hypothetical protein MHY20_05700 [Helcobacillus sp. ACRRO]|uniref:hypothetical protein n=1 Tax=Helcobacillus sp. ACRRO TaxID=2918202 RepID=UPI001EF53FAE|nr:hypothetical protein [Helcobacillus sp. ACRRO]MCG7427111.1 hypothetical protein [Helcobacillus sp. ACRRO]
MTQSPQGPDDKDRVDAEFAAMMEGLDFDTSSLDDPLTAAGGPAADSSQAQDPSAPAPIAIVATPVATAKALAGVIRLAMAAKEDPCALPTGSATIDADSGALAVGPLTEADAHRLAGLVSIGLQRQGVVLFWRQGDRMTATRYRSGERMDDVPPAFVLGALDSRVEDLLLGAESVAEAENVYDPAELSRTEAVKWIATGRKRKR